jgi:tRNA(fMet)-specific endonuclease VapC
MGLLIDSTVFIHAERARQAPIELLGDLHDRFGDQELALSVMTAGELIHGCWHASDERRRSRREEFVESILAAVPATPLSLPIMRVFGRLDAEQSAKGRRLPTSDLLIAGTAFSREDEIVTGNIRHFDRIPRLVVHRYP